MSKYSHLIPVIFVSVFFFSLLSAQERIQETLLLVQSQPGEQVLTAGGSFLASGSLGSKLFAYSRIIGESHLVVLEEDRERTLLTREKIHDVQVSRDDSRIVFATSGVSWYFPLVIYSIFPDGSRLTELVSGRFDCDGLPSPQYGSPLCSFPRYPKLSPDGQKVLFFEAVHSFDDDLQDNVSHYYLSMVPVTGGPTVRLEEVEYGIQHAAWSEDSTSIYYFYSHTLQRYDLETGRPEPLTDASLRVGGPLEVSRADGSLYLFANQQLTRLDPETGFSEVISEELFDSFDLSPDGRRVVGLKDGDLTLIDIEFPFSSLLQVEPGAVDELALGQIPAARENWAIQKMQVATSYSTMTALPSRAREATGVKQVRWIDNDRLWCVVHEDKSIDPTADSTPEVRVGIAQLD